MKIIRSHLLNPRALLCVKRAGGAISKTDEITSSRLLLTVCSLLLCQQLSAGTLEEVRGRGFINCGVHSSLTGFSMQTTQGWQGMEVDLCRAVAAAVLSDAQSVRFRPIAGEQGYSALQSGDLDILVRHNDWTMLADTALGLTFVAPWFYREQGFLARTPPASGGIQDLAGRKICSYPATDREINLSGLGDAQVEKVSFPSFGIALKAFENKLCDAVGGELIQLRISAHSLTETDSLRIIRDNSSPNATGPLIRQQDQEWFKIVRWSINWLLKAEQLGLTRETISQIDADNPVYPVIRQAGFSGVSLGLSENWPVQIIQQVGNYGEIFQRYFGEYQVDRGINRLLEDGGLHVAPPMK